MNVHVPQSIQSAIELMLIANVIERFVSPANSSVVISSKQDTLMGSYILTQDNTFLNYADAMDIVMATSIGSRNSLIKKDKISGKELCSQIIPSDINVLSDKIKIVNGVIMQGVLGKSEIGMVTRRILNQHGGKRAQEFIDDLQRLNLEWLMRRGCTIGFKDTILPDTIHEQIKNVINTAKKSVLSTITTFENNPSIMSKKAHEEFLHAELESVGNEVANIVMKNYDKQSGLYNAIMSGSSGLPMNASQISGAISQVFVEDARISLKYNGRSLPCFAKGDDSAEARGFCDNSFFNGLTYTEFFFQVMAGREGLINTAIKTADTGYVQRKLIKFFEDIKVSYDGTVRNANDKIIQFVYGDNGINVEKQIPQKIEFVSMNNEDIRKNYIHSPEEIKKMSGIDTKKYNKELMEKFYDKIIGMRDLLRYIQTKTRIVANEFNDTYNCPVDLTQYIANILNRENRKVKELVDPLYVMKRLRKMIDGVDTKIMKYNNSSIIKIKDEKRVKLVTKAYLYDKLAPKKCIDKHGFSKEEFDEIVNYFIFTMKIAKIEGGEMAGMVSAQSIGEPVTQANLKSFHKSGTGAGVTGGLPRVKELLGVSKNIKTSIMNIALDEEISNDKNAAEKISSHLRYTIFKDVVGTCELFYDPNPNDKSSITSKDGATQIMSVSSGNRSGCQSEIDNLPWLLRLVISKEKMIERNVSLLDIKTSFCNNWGRRHDDNRGSKNEYKIVIDRITQCAVTSNFDNSDIPVVHIRFNASVASTSTFIKFQDMIMETFRIKGIKGIVDSRVVEEKYVAFDDDGNSITNKRFIVSTNGLNLHEISQIKGVVLEETFINDIVTIHEIYGVEAARHAYIKEMSRALGSSGGNANYQHLELLADAVTHMGGLIPVNRHGANKLDTDPLSRASFEKTVEQMIAAAAFAESDNIRSISSRIMIGALINGGTGAFDVLLDHNKLKTGSFEVTKKEVIEEEEKPVQQKASFLKSVLKKKKESKK